MDTRIDPITLHALRDFGRRRNYLILIRGLCALLTTILTAMAAVALVDYAAVLSDRTRLLLSTSAYALTVVVFVLVCLRRLLARCDLRELAVMIEQQKQDFHEQVLSAVELGQQPPQTVCDSLDMRSCLQRFVARRIGQLDRRELLPAALIRRWVLLAAAALLGFAGLFFVPGLRFDHLIVRALAPRANLGRISQVQVRILEPAEDGILIPRGDPLEIVVELSGPQRPDEEAYLEFRGDQDEPALLLMEPRPERRFASTLLMNKERLSYRIRAGDAVTRYYTANSASRPHVVRFHKTYHYPDYSRLDDETVVETHGRIAALTGSRISWRLDIDQPVRSAELRLELDGKKQTIPLAEAGPGQLTATAPLTASGTYRVHLVAAETGFDNKFSPHYEIQALPDLVPRVVIENPSRDLILPPDEMVDFRGRARDDLGLGRVSQMIRVNDGPWQEQVLEEDPENPVLIQRRWDLLLMELKAGDRVHTKLAAVDRKANRGESAEVQITIGSGGFSPRRRETMEQQRRLQAGLAQLDQAVEQLADAYQQLASAVAGRAEPTQIEGRRLAARSQYNEVAERARQAWQAVLDSSYPSETLQDSEDLQRIGRALSRLRRDELGQIEQTLAKALPDAPAAREHLEQARPLLDDLGNLARKTAEAHNAMLAATEARNIADDLARLREYQDRTIEQAEIRSDRPEVRRQLTRRQSAAVEELALVEDTFDHFAEHISSNHAGSVRNLADRLRTKRQEWQSQLAPPPEDPSTTPAPPQEVAEQMRQNLADTAKDFAWLKRSADSAARQGRENLDRLLGQPPEPVRQLAEALREKKRQEQTLAQLLQETAQNANRLGAEIQKTDRLAGQADQRWHSTIGQLQDRAELEEHRPQADYAFVADTAQVAQALAALAAADSDPQRAEQTAESLAQIEAAYKTLSAGHSVDQARMGLEDLAGRERWSEAQHDRAYRSADDWKHLKDLLDDAPKQIEQARLPREIRQLLGRVPNSEPAQQVGREMSSRDQDGRIVSAQDQPLLDLGREMRQASSLLAPHLEQARQQIDHYAPSIAEQVAGVETRTDQVRQETEDLAQQAKPTEATAPLSPDTLGAKADELLGLQQQLNEQVDTVRDSIRRDANRQDLSEIAGQERARDADDALAMLRQPGPRALDALQRAADPAAPPERSSALQQAADQQRQLQDALDLIGRHYANLDNGDPDSTRRLLRGREEPLDMRQALDRQYDRIEQLAALGRYAPDQLRKLLEAQLPENQAMQRELALLTANTLNNALERMENTVRQEGQIGERLDEIARRQQEKSQPVEQLQQQENELQQRAARLAQDTGELADRQIPASAQSAQAAGAQAQPEYDQARQAAASAREDLGRDFAGRAPASLAGQFRQAAQSLAQSQEQLQRGVGKIRAATDRDNRPQAESAAEQTQQASRRAKDLARQANDLAGDLEKLANAMSEQLDRSDRRQDELRQATDRIADDVSRAALHARRLDRPYAQPLGQSGQAIQGLSDQEMTQARDALAQARQAAQAQPSVAQAYQQADRQLQNLKNVLQNAASITPDSSAATPGSPAAATANPTSRQTAQWMARTLDQLDAAAQGLIPAADGQTDGQPAGQTGQADQMLEAARQTMQQALQSQQAALAQARGQDAQPGQASADAPRQRSQTAQSGRMNPDSEAPYLGAGVLPDDVLLGRGDWGRLRSRRADDLSEAGQEAVPEDYRRMINAYFQAISRQAREK